MFFFFFFEKLKIRNLVFFFNFSGPVDMEVRMMLRTLSWRNGRAIWA